MSISWLTQKRRTIARLLLLWLALGGQLFCTSHAGFGVEVATEVAESPVRTCCGGNFCAGDKAATSEPELQPLCCESPSSFCCGDGKHGSADVADSEFGNAGITAAPLPQYILLNSFYAPAAFPRWTQEIVLRRSDPPTYLRNCSFLD